MTPLEYYIYIPIPFLYILITNITYMFIQTCIQTIDFILIFLPQNLFKLNFEKYIIGISILLCIYLDMSWLYKLLKLQNMFDAGTLLGFLSTLIPLTKEITNDFKASYKIESSIFLKILYIPFTIFFNVLYVSLFYTQYFLIHETIVEEKLNKIFISFFKSQFNEFSKTIKLTGDETNLFKLIDEDINNGFDTFLFLFSSFLSNITESNLFKMTALGSYIIYIGLKLSFDTLRHIFYAKRNKLNLKSYKNYHLNITNNNLIPKIVFLMDSTILYAIKRKIPFQKIEKKF